VAFQYAPAGRFAIFAGSTQRLANQDTMIGWAASTQAVASEVDPAGHLLWEIKDLGSPPYFTYRAIKASVPDATPPAVDLVSPAAGASYVQGDAVPASYDCTDRGGSSLFSCLGDVTSGALLETGTPGTHTFSVTATDGAGRVGTVRRTYVVRAAARPDAMIRVAGTRGFTGNGAYGSSRSQRVRARIAHRHGRVSLLVRLQNAVARPDRLSFTTRRGPGPFRLVGPHADGGVTPLLAPGTSETFRLKVVRRGSARPGDRLLVRLPVHSRAAPSLRDAVSFVVKAG
jgi:hypothetical protein